VLLARRYYAVKDVVAAAVPVTAGGDEKMKVTLHGDVRAEVAQQWMRVPVD
jgi:hypothetical protein